MAGFLRRDNAAVAYVARRLETGTRRHQIGRPNKSLRQGRISPRYVDSGNPLALAHSQPRSGISGLVRSIEFAPMDEAALLSCGAIGGGSHSMPSTSALRSRSTLSQTLAALGRNSQTRLASPWNTETPGTIERQNSGWWGGEARESVGALQRPEPVHCADPVRPPMPESPAAREPVLSSTNTPGAQVSDAYHLSLELPGLPR